MKNEQKDTKQENHLKREGKFCPNCNSDGIKGTNLIANRGSATQDMECSNCHFKWADVYKLVEFMER